MDDVCFVFSGTTCSRGLASKEIRTRRTTQNHSPSFSRFAPHLPLLPYHTPTGRTTAEGNLNVGADPDWEVPQLKVGRAAES